MKRLIVVALVAAFLVALPASHLVMGNPPPVTKVKICHLTPPGNADRTGVIISVPITGGTRNAHIKHGDCQEGAFPRGFDDLGNGRCRGTCAP